MPTVADGAKMVFLDMNLQHHRIAMGVQVIVKDPKEIENIKQREMDIAKERIHKILDTGVNIVLTTKGADDLCMMYFVEAGVLCAQRCNSEDLWRLAKATDGKLVITMANMEGIESFDITCTGEAKLVRGERIMDGEMIYMYGCKWFHEKWDPVGAKCDIVNKKR
mmetsp:Transcript_30169/g.34759  ORF Transcript_30169/g.34759 Transcript_30169/m.34759 type:complete len:165 (-) Transcript_30169:225-719(-)